VHQDPEIAFGRYLIAQGMIDQEQAREAYRLLQGYRKDHPQVNLAQVLAKHQIADRDALREAFQGFSASQSGQYPVGSSGSQLVKAPSSSQSGAIPHTIDPDAMVGSGMFGQPSDAPIPHTIDPDAMVGSGMFGQPSGSAIPNTIDPDAMVGSGMFGSGAIPNTIDPDGSAGSGMFNTGGSGAIPNTIDPDASAGSGAFSAGSGAFPAGSGAFSAGSGAFAAGSGMFPGGSGAFPGGSGGFPGAIPNTIDPDAMGGGDGPVIPHTMDPDGGSGGYAPGGIPQTIDPDAMAGGGPVIPHTMDPDGVGPGGIPQTIDPDAMRGGGPVIPHTMDPDGPTLPGSGVMPGGSGFGRPAGSGFGAPGGSGFGSHGSQFPPGSQGFGSHGPGSHGYGLLPSGSHGPQSRGPGGTRPDGSRGPGGTRPDGSRGPAGTQKQGTGFQLDLAPAPDKPSPFRKANAATPNSLSQVIDDEDDEEDVDGKPRRKSARRRAAHPALRREPKKPLWIVFVAGLAVVVAVGIGLSMAGQASRDQSDLKRWSEMSDEDAATKLAEGEQLSDEVKAMPDVAAKLEELQAVVDAEKQKAEALEVLDGLEKALTLDERKKICDRALELDKTLAKAWVERARIRFALDRRAAADKKAGSMEPTDITKGARADLNQAIGFDSTSAEAYLFSSELYIFENDGRAALGSLRRVEELDPEGALGRLARGLKEEMSRRYGDALTHYDRAIELNSKLVAAYLARARVYVTQGTHSKAIASADQARNLDPSSSEAHVLLAMARYYASGRSDQGVLKILDKALELDPSNSKALALRAYARLDRSQSDKVISSPAECKRAVDDATRANAIRPEVLAYMALAEVAIWEEDEKTKAQKYAKDAIGLDGRNPDAFILRARIRLLANTYEEADRDLERVLTLAESRPGTEEITARALTMRAGIRVKNKDFTAAKDLLKRAIKLKDDLAEAHFYYAKVLHHDPKRQSGDWRKSEQEYSKAISLDGTLADAWFHRGALHIDRSRGEATIAKEWEAGLDDLDKAEELMNSKYGSYFAAYYLDLMRGCAYFGLKEWERAKKHLTRFVEEASPGEENYAKAKKMLREIEAELE